MRRNKMVTLATLAEKPENKVVQCNHTLQKLDNGKVICSACGMRLLQSDIKEG